MVLRNAIVTGIVLAASSSALAGVVVDLGSFQNTSPSPSFEYSGDFGAYTGSSISTLDMPRTVISLDLAGILQEVGATHLHSITVRDLGQNTYGELSPGADIDLLEVATSFGTAAGTVSYTGPNGLHSTEHPGTLMYRIAMLDSLAGNQDAWQATHISLGNAGAMTLSFLDGIAGGPDGHSGGSGEDPEGGNEGGAGDPPPPPPGGIWIGHLPELRLSEAGIGERFSIEAVVATPEVPAPSAAVVLLGAVACRRRRRRA